MEGEQNNAYLSQVDQKLQKGAMIYVKDPKKIGEDRNAYITFLIEIDGQGVRRRYSDFESFRENLIKQNPSSLVPPLPEKQPVSVTGMTSGSRVQESSEFIEKRRKRLEVFLNRLAKHTILGASRFFHKFLEVDNWAQVIAEENAAAAAQEKGGFLSSLSILERKVQKQDPKFAEIGNHAHNFGQHTAAVERNCRKLLRRQNDLASDFAELGGDFNAFAGTEKELGPALEKCGGAADAHFLAFRFLNAKVDETFLDPLQDYVLYSGVIKSVLLKREQLQAVAEGYDEQLASKKAQLKTLESTPVGQPEAGSGFFKSFTSSVAKMLDSNPEQTRKDNIQKLQTAVAELETEVEKSNSTLVRNSEAITFDIQDYEKKKVRELREFMLSYAQAQVEFYQKLVQSWGFVVPVIEEIPDRT